MVNVGEISATAVLDDSDYRNRLSAMPSLADKYLGKFAKMAAAYLSLRTVAGKLSEFVGMWMTQEKAVVSLQSALRNQGAEYNVLTQELGRFASGIQEATIYGDEGTLQAMALGLNMGIAAEKIREATKAAVGLAAANNMELNAAMQVIARAANGMTERLRMYGIQVDTTKSKQEQFNAVLEQCGAKFSIAEEQAKTMYGVVQQATNDFGDLKEQVGRAVVVFGGLSSEISGADSLIKTLTNTLDANMMRWNNSLQKFLNTIVARGLALGSWISSFALFAWTTLVTPFENLVDVVGACFRELLLLASKFGTAFWDMVTGGGTSGFDGFFDGFGEKFREAIQRSNDKFSGQLSIERRLFEKGGYLWNSVDALNADTERRYARQMAEANRPRGGSGSASNGQYSAESANVPAPEANRQKGDVAGAFSAAVLTALFGANSPEAETAKNTKTMVELQRRLLAGKGGTYA